MSARLGVAFLTFWGGLSVYLLRINFSIAIVCMTYDAKENITDGVNETFQQMYKPLVNPDMIDFNDITLSSSEADVCPSDGEDEQEEVTKNTLAVMLH